MLEEQKMRKIDERDTGEFGTLIRSEKTITILLILRGTIVNRTKYCY